MRHSAKASPKPGPMLRAVCSSMRSCSSRCRNLRLPMRPILARTAISSLSSILPERRENRKAFASTSERLDQLMGATHEPDRVFHYLPFNFAASTILMLSCLARESVLTLSTDLNKLADEIRLASPNYFLNVPTLLERVRRGVEEAIAKRPAVIRLLFRKARAAWPRLHVGRGH